MNNDSWTDYLREKFIGGQIVGIEMRDNRLTLLVEAEDGRERDFTIYNYDGRPLAFTWKKTPVLV